MSSAVVGCAGDLACIIKNAAEEGTACDGFEGGQNASGIAGEGEVGVGWCWEDSIIGSRERYECDAVIIARRPNCVLSGLVNMSVTWNNWPDGGTDTENFVSEMGKESIRTPR